MKLLCRLPPVAVPFQIPGMVLDWPLCQRLLQIVGFLGSHGWVQLSIALTSPSHPVEISGLWCNISSCWCTVSGINGISSFWRLKNHIFSDGKNRKVSDGSSPGKESERAARESVRDENSSLRLIVDVTSEGRLDDSSAAGLSWDVSSFCLMTEV